MGQAASMCRFRGCRYKKNKASKAASHSPPPPPPPAQATASAPASGLHLRSIEEPSSQASPHSHTLTHAQSRMPAEQGGTGYGSDSSLLGSRAGVPLQLQGAPHPLSPQKGYDAEHARMESWMDENPEFVQDYFIRKATRQVVDAWLVSHATSAGNDVGVGSPTHANGQSCSSRGGSGATTPVRKISAHEFERGGLLKPIVNTIDGTPTFLSIGNQNDCSANNGSAGVGNVGPGGSGQYHHNHHHHHGTLHHHHYQHHLANHHQSGPGAGGGGAGGGAGGVGAGGGGGGGGANAGGGGPVASGGGCGGGQGGVYGSHNFHRPQRLSRIELKQLDEKELIFELVKDICNELEVRTLCHKILQNVSILLNADRGSLFLVQGRCNGSDGPKKCLVSKLFDVCPRSTVEEMEQQEEVRVAWGTGIAGHVAESGEPVNIPDAYQDNRFNHEIDSQTGYRTKALLCMPIKDSSGDVIGVAQVINKLNGECFSEVDEKVFASYLQFCGIGLRNAQLYEKSQLEIKRNQVLLDLARMIFEEQSTIEHMVFRILTHMQSLIQCQRVQILLVHEASKGSFSRVFDFEANDLSQEDSISRTSPFESRFPINVGITGHVATTGETVNIPNAYEDDRFDPSVDENSSFKHKSILCMAIKNSLGQIIGVIQLINKFDDLNFTKNDENFVEAFAIFCGMGIHNTHMYEKAIVAMAKQSVTLEVLSYHASATIDEAHRLRRLRVPSAAHFRLHDFKFDDIHFEDDDTLKACLRMFLDLDFVERFHIDYEVLCRWLLSVKKNYRNVTYHNWRHAFNVAQMMFAILTATQWWKVFGEIECLALIIGCLCHDLDHRGTNNSFQIKASSPLAQLYSTSTMEHHHFDQCLMILNSPGNQILANLTSEDYCRVIRVLEDAILSTDLAVYFRKRGPFLQTVQEQPGSFWVEDEPRALLRAMSMTVCDLSAITKPWEIEKRVADLVSSEFFEQGDMEKQELNITPIDIMNREKEDELPMMQVGFIESICLPIYEAFANLSDKLEPLVEGVRDNRQHWIEMAADVQKKQANGAVLAASNNNNSGRDGDNNGSHCSSPADDCAASPANGSHVEAALEAQTAVDEDERLALDEPEGPGDEDEVGETTDVEDEGDDDEDEDDTDDDNDVCVVGHVRHSPSCPSSEASSRAPTPPPTGEDDDSTPTSPAKLGLVNNLGQKALRTRGCRSCDQPRNHNHVRKASSLKGANEMRCQRLASAAAMATAPNGCGCHGKSKSTPAMAGCGSQQQQPVSGHLHHGHGHHHHHHHGHHGHHAHHHHHNPPAAVGGESDKIPKIVGKLGNLDSMQLYPTTADPIPLLHHPPNGLGFTPNGHFNYLPGQAALGRRHSETNGQAGAVTPAAATTTTTVSPTAVCEK